MLLIKTIAPFVIFIIDYISKTTIRNFLLIHKQDLHINQFISLTHLWNPGISFGLLKFISPIILIIITIILIIYLIFLLIKEKARAKTYALILIIGGASGNLHNRIFYDAVYDFIDLHIDKYHWPVFNFADSAIVIGSILYLITNNKKHNAAV